MALQLQERALLGGWVYGALVLGAAAIGCFVAIQLRASVLRSLLLCAACAALGFGSTGLRAHAFLQTALPAALEGQDITVVGTVAAMPQKNEGGLRFRLDVESARLQGAAVALPPAIYLGWYGGVLRDEMDAVQDTERSGADLRAGERWRMVVRLKAPHGNVNPHGFDYELWLWEQGLQATGYVRAGTRDAPPVRLGTSWAHPIERARHAVRDAIFAAVPSPRVAGVVAALVVGDQAAIERADWDIFRATGVAHLMSISGLHVTMFAWAAALLVGWLWRRSALWGWPLCHWLAAPHAALLGGVALATGYALFSGWGVPSQRTVCMLAVVAALRLAGVRWPWQMVWLLACVVVVACDPWALLQAGFWLSFVAVGVLFVTTQYTPDLIAKERLNTLAPRGFGIIFEKTKALFREQWVVTLALTPLSLLLFNQVSVVGLLANALAIPWVTLVVTPLAMGGVLWAPLWTAAGWAVQALGVFLQALSALPFATVSIAAAPLWAAACGVLGGVLLAMRLPWGLRGFGLPLLLPVLLWQSPRPLLGEFELLAADIGQGNAVLVRTRSHSLLYDAGPRFSRDSDAGHRTLVPLLRALGERLDTLVLSHRDADHTGGAKAVLAMQTQAALLSSLETGHELHALRPASLHSTSAEGAGGVGSGRAGAQAGARASVDASAVPSTTASTRCTAGQRWQWDGVDFEILAPTAADYDANLKSNAMSCVLRVASARRTALLVGDIEAPQEAALVAQGAPLKADVLLVPHHGSKTSSSPAFLDAVQPRWAIVQAGYRNRFGHPAVSVMARYDQRAIAVLASPACGALRWSSAQAEPPQCERVLGQRYWRHALAP